MIAFDEDIKMSWENDGISCKHYWHKVIKIVLCCIMLAPTRSQANSHFTVLSWLLRNWFHNLPLRQKISCITSKCWVFYSSFIRFCNSLFVLKRLHVVVLLASWKKNFSRREKVISICEAIACFLQLQSCKHFIKCIWFITNCLQNILINRLNKLWN